jgi:Methyltransferase domain
MSRSFKSRFFTQKGDFAICSLSDALDSGRSLLTSILKVTVRRRVREPSIARNAFRSISPYLSEGSRVFAWGSGMSTFWFEEHCAEVYTVEHNAEQYGIVSRQVKRAQVSLRTGQAYIDEILKFPDGYFDLISIDGAAHCACLRVAIPKLKESGILIVDNTDKDRINQRDLFPADAHPVELKQVCADRAIGQLPGNFFPQETAACAQASAGVKAQSRV